MTWQLAAVLIVGAALLAGFAWYEHSRPPAKVVALVAALAALAVVGRIAFAPFPNVKPTTDIVLLSGYALGPIPGFAVGAITALASNVVLGQGPWTAWQMLAWGGVGAAGALLAKLARERELSRVTLALACGAAGLAFGALMDVYQWTLAAEQTLASYGAVSASSLPYNLAHAIGNVVFCLLVGPLFLRALKRYRRRFEVSWPAPAAAAAPGSGPAPGSATATATAAALMLALVLAAPLVAAPPEAEAASATKRATRYLLRAQNRDGGFGGERGQSSNQLFTGWAALGLASARRNPRDARRRRGRAATTYIRRRAGRLNDTGELERTILILKSAGLSARRFAGRDLVAELLRRRRGNGSWGGNVAHTAFGVLALRAVGEPAGSGRLRASTRYLARAQNGDGGFGFVPSASSDVDDTGAALQALATAGAGGGPAARQAVGYLRRRQRGDGGFGQMRGRSSNAQSTAWAVQGFASVGISAFGVRKRTRSGTGGRSAIDYLRSLQQSNGAIRYSRFSSQTPVWVTAQALTALRRKPFPLATVPRRRRAGSSAEVDAGSATAARKRAPRRRARERAGPREEEAAEQSSGLPGAGAQPEASAAEVKTTNESDAGGPSPWLVVALSAATLGGLALARRRLRRRRLAGP